MVRRYALALLLVGLALAATLLVHQLFSYPFLFLFFAAVILSAWQGGTGAGLFAVLLSTVAVEYFFLPPFFSFTIRPADVAYLMAFTASALAGSWVSSAQREDREALRRAHNELELRVAERTAELQQANTELRDRQRQLRLLTEVIPQQIWSAAPDGAIDYCNQRLLDYVGRMIDATRGELFVSTLHADDRENFRDCWQKSLAGGRPLEGEWRIRGADGQYRWFFTRAVPLRGASGEIVRWYGTSTDIEERKRSEQALMTMQGEISHLSRVLTMGELATSIAHEVNQPLAAVVTYGHACLEWLAQDPPNLEEARHTAERIIKDGSRAGAVIGRMRALVKKEPAAKGRIDFNELARDLLTFLHDEAMRHGITVLTEYAAILPPVEGDRVQLQQVLLNLIVNSMDALRRSAEHGREILLATAANGTDKIAVRVEDSGAGLRADDAEKIFAPFFTTKPQGIGMGLAMSRSIVESHGGRLWAAPRPAGGVVFQFTLPALPIEPHE